ncbi:lipoate--protein ligase family protein [Roseimaritima sediminicola]|uniref:lipoate--protein ligase family protein n=1 Tax=Roseimaritima sediminicola TaxID=2662066 RepID=UPI00129850F2|nr:lipoate--protein ligase family protein [Roseimaritima sediminicola]
MPHLLRHTLEKPAENLALDEALLMTAEADEGPPVLRLWQFRTPTVILGRGSRIADEVDLTFCQQHGIPVLRRCSGGASVVGGPTCLMYSLVIDLRAQPQLRKLDNVHPYVMQRVLLAVQRSLPEIAAERLRFQGTCDLTLDDCKFSGNSLRMARNHSLYHGTLLLDADLDLVAGCLATAPRQPDYRQGRSHRQFITNLPACPERLAEELARVFAAEAPLETIPERLTGDLARQRYATAAWTHRH